MVPAVLAHALALLAIGPGKSPDTAFGAIDTGAVCVIFAIWWLGLAGWGRLIASKLVDGPAAWWLALAAGSAFVSLTGAGLGHLGLIGPGSRWGFALLTYAGIALGGFGRRVAGPSDEPRASGFGLAPKILLGLMAVIVGLRAYKALTPWDQSDPLFYQLLAPRVWLDLGRITLPARMPILFEAGAWEYLHLWGMRLVSAEPGRGLIEGQLFGQLTHVAVGYLGACLALYALSRKVLRLEPLPATVAVLAAMSVRDLSWVVKLAKNDWGGTAWLLAAAALALQPDPRARRAARPLAGALLGMAIGAKLTNVPIGAAIVAAAAWVEAAGDATGTVNAERDVRRGIRAARRLAAITAIFALPVYARNWWLASNPFFPFLTRAFPSAAMTPGLFGVIGFYELDPRSASLAAKLARALPLFARDEILLLPGLLLPPLLAWRSPSARRALALWAPAAIGALALLSQPALLEARHLGASLVLLAALGPASLSWITPRWPRARVALLVAASLALVAYGDLLRTGSYGDLALRRVMELRRPADEVIRHGHLAGEAKTWIRLHASPTDRIITTGDRQLYYLSGFESFAFNDDRGTISRIEALPRPALGLPAPEAVLRAFKESGARYMLDTMPRGTPEVVSRSLLPYLIAHPEIVVFRSPTASVWDLSRVP